MTEYCFINTVSNSQPHILNIEYGTNYDLLNKFEVTLLDVIFKYIYNVRGWSHLYKTFMWNFYDELFMGKVADFQFATTTFRINGIIVSPLFRSFH